MKQVTCFATVLVAVCVASTGAMAQNVYRCGNTYSQKPCAEGVQVDVQDSRTPAQKAESQAAVRREASTADAMEKARLKEEARSTGAGTKATASPKDKKVTSKPSATDTPAGTANHSPSKGKAQKMQPKKKKEPEYFTARALAAEKPKSAASKGK